MANANPSRLGTIPAEAQLRGRLNASTDAEQRDPGEITKDTKLAAGPEIGEAGEYLPAIYKLPSGNIRTDR